MKSIYKRILQNLTLILLVLLLINNSNNRNNYFIQNSVKSSEYDNVISRTVDPVNLTAGMSYSSNLNYNMNNSKNLLEIPAPPNQEFNASFVNITMGNIKAPDENFYLQSYNKRGQLLLETNRLATSFTIPSNCYLRNASFYFNIIAGNPIVAVRLHNSTWNNTLGINQPYGNPYNPDHYRVINISTPGVSGAGWVNFTFNISEDTYLNNSRTDNNSWYIGLTVGAGSVGWCYELDGENEDDDNSLAYHYISPNWLLTSDSGDTVDYTAKFGFSNGETIYSQTYNKRGQLPLEINRLATSFAVPSNCYLTNASFHLNVTAGDPIVAVRLHNSTWNSTFGINQPYGNPYNPNHYKVLNISTPGVSGAHWVNFTFPISEDSFLNNSHTDNNTWYIGLVVGAGAVGWNYELDGENDDDNSFAYHFSSPNWLLTTDSGDTVDYTVKIGVTPSGNFTIKPSNVGLKINGTAVKDVNNTIYNGQWVNTQILTPRSDGKLILDVTTDYWDVSWTIYNISVKYIKTDLKATTNFTIQLGSDVNWEVNQAVEVFSSNFTDFILNFTISDTWTVTNCYNISSADPHTFLEWDKTGPYKEISIDDVGNSSNWRLFCTSINFADDISILVDSTNSITVHYLDDLQFVAGFNDKITGDVNLTIYSSSGFINYTTVFGPISNEHEVTFPLVDLSDFISEYGNYIVQYHWYNATHVAYLEEDFIVLANTQLSLISPSQDTDFAPSDTFNITLYYQDIGIIGPIDDATIYYEIDGGGTQLVNINNGTSGYYEILIDCSTLGTGYKTVDLSANKTLYQSQTMEYNFYISSPSSDGEENTLLIIAITVPIVAILAIVGIIFYLKKKK